MILVKRIDESKYQVFMDDRLLATFSQRAAAIEYAKCTERTLLHRGCKVEGHSTEES